VHHCSNIKKTMQFADILTFIDLHVSWNKLMFLFSLETGLCYGNKFCFPFINSLVLKSDVHEFHALNSQSLLSLCH
jgi:hypothetical protein